MSQIEQPLRTFEFASPGQVLLDHLVEDTSSGELAHLVLTDDYTRYTNESLRQVTLLGEAVLRYPALFSQKNQLDIDVYLDFARPQLQACSVEQSESAIKLCQNMEHFWKRAFQTSPTRYLARSRGQLQQVLAAKQLLLEEIQAVQEIEIRPQVARHQACDYIVECFDQEREQVLALLETGLEGSAFAVDVLLRRACLRLFAEAWLEEAYLRELFLDQLDGKRQPLRYTGFGDEKKPIWKLTQFQAPPPTPAPSQATTPSKQSIQTAHFPVEPEQSFAPNHGLQGNPVS